MKPNFFIKYKGVRLEQDSNVDFVSLGESIIGFDKLIREMVKISKINGNVKVNATKIRDGSLVVDTVTEVVNNYDQLPFDKVQDLLDFLLIVNEGMWIKGQQFFSEIGGMHRTLNDYFAKNPLDYTLVGLFIAEMIRKSKNQKKKVVPEDKLPNKYAIKLHKLVNKGTFKKAIKPIVEEKITSIQVSENDTFENSPIINQNNFENYLGEDDKILSEYEHGKIYKFIGEIVAVQSAKGDSMTFQVKLDKKWNLVLLPPEGKTTADFIKFYRNIVVVDAQILRDSFYKKPHLSLKNIELQQKPLEI